MRKLYVNEIFGIYSHIFKKLQFITDIRERILQHIYHRFLRPKLKKKLKGALDTSVH